MSGTAATAMAAWLNAEGVGGIVGMLMVLGGLEAALAWFERAAAVAEL